MKKLWIMAAIAASFASCSDKDISGIEDQNLVSELSLSTSVLTHTSKSKAAFTTENGDGFHTGPVMDTQLANSSAIGVTVFNAGTNNLYTTANEGNAENMRWTNINGWKYIDAAGTAHKFFLGAAKADIVAYFPYEGTNYNRTQMPVQAGYTDFMYGRAAENGALFSASPRANIALDHAMSMVSFTFAKGEGYTGNCNLQSITINKTLRTGTMNTLSGVITNGTQTTDLRIASLVNGVYTPANTEEAGTTASWAEWQNISFATNTNKENALGKPSVENKQAGQFHAMVLPQKFTSAIGESFFTVKIDGIVYEVAFKQGQGYDITWIPGQNHTYNLTLNGGNELVITSVTVTPWSEGEGGDIEI